MHSQITLSEKIQLPRCTFPHLPISSALLLCLALCLISAKPARAADPLGNVTASQVSCESVHGGRGVRGATCYLAQVSCPGINDIPVALKVNQPRGKSQGTVLFTIGGGGTLWYDVHFIYGALAIQQVIDAGYTTAQINFEFPPRGRGNAPFTGWLTGPGGPRALACRWASLAQWIHDNIRLPNTPYCATGSSAGAGAASYALAHYAMGPEFDMLEHTSGPPFTRIDHGCLCNEPALKTPCRSGKISECYQAEAGAFLDPAYNNKACSQAERTHRSPFEQIFHHDSLDSDDAIFDYPNTDIHFVFGGLDTSPGVAQGAAWIPLITGKSTLTVDCVADAPHEIPDVFDGAMKIADDLINYCH
jgi:hypothetical protein